MPAVRNAHKKGLPKIIRSPIRERGQVKHGGKREMSFSSKTPHALHAEIAAKFHITKDTMSTVDQSIFFYQKLKHTAPDVIWVSIGVDSSASNVEKLEQNERVRSAIHALVLWIKKELYLEESADKESGTGKRPSLGERLRKRYKEV